MPISGAWGAASSRAKGWPREAGVLKQRLLFSGTEEELKPAIKKTDCDRGVCELFGDSAGNEDLFYEGDCLLVYQYSRVAGTPAGPNLSLGTRVPGVGDSRSFPNLLPAPGRPEYHHG